MVRDAALLTAREFFALRLYEIPMSVPVWKKGEKRAIFAHFHAKSRPFLLNSSPFQGLQPSG
jgi:hypothetical protein